MRYLGFVTIILCGGLLLWHTAEFADWGDPKSPAATHLSPYFIKHTIRDTAVPNIVTSVLADYRGYDTMFETTVVFTAGLACFFLLRVTRRKTPESRLYRHIPTGVTFRIGNGKKLPENSNYFERMDALWTPYDIILRSTIRLIVPFTQLYALYVLAHGHHSPGGGFQGGVILGASIILFAICFNLREAIARVGEKALVIISSIGVFMYAGTGALCMIYGAGFLDYGALAPLLGCDPVMARSHGILIVETGVALAVTSVMVWIYYNLSSAGRHDEGL